MDEYHCQETTKETLEQLSNGTKMSIALIHDTCMTIHKALLLPAYLFPSPSQLDLV